MKLKKGSIEAKRFMSKIRAKKKPVKKISGIKESNKLKKELKAKKLRLTHGYTTIKRKLSGVIKNRSLGASGDYAKFEIAVIKNLSKLLKKTYKKVQEIVNTDESLLNIISKNFDKKISVSITAKELKAKLIIVAKKNPLDSFIEILNKLPKKDQVSKGVKFPIKLPATVSIGSLKNSNEMILNDLKVLEYRRNLAIGQEESFLNISTNFNVNSIQYKKNKKIAREYTNLIKYYTLQINKLKKLIK